VRLVLDTNIVVAALLWAGRPRQLLDRAIDDDSLELYSTPVLLDELIHTLQYPKFAQRIGRYATTPAALTAQYAALVTLVSPTQVPRVIEQDADDDHVIAAAVTGQADLIAAGDKRDLLPMGSFQGIPIITAREAVERLEARLKT